MHNRSYVENQYLLYHCRRVCPEARRYYYQNGRMSLMWKDDFIARRAAQIHDVIHRNKWLAAHHKITGILVNILNKFKFFVNYRLLPFVICGVVFRPPLNVTNGEIDAKATRQFQSSKKDYLLAYLDNEIEAYRSQGITNIFKIQHPLRGTGHDVFTFLYGEIVETDCILILPSYGFTSRLIEDGWSVDAVVGHVASRWSDTIRELQDRLHGYELKIKLHPESRNDLLWKRIVDKITGQFPKLEIVPTEESAEWHVVRSRVIVGDVTTVLWWAGLYGGENCP